MRDDPPGHHGPDLEDRLTGLGLILGGVLGFGLAYWIWTLGPATLPMPPGSPHPILPILSPITCMLPLCAIGSCMLVLLGLRRLLFDD